MSTHVWVSLTASLLITAGLFVSLAASVGRTPPADPPATIDGLPVTNLPGITVHPSTADAATCPSNDHRRTVATVSNGHTFNRLLEAATAQVASSHLSMPYYSFGSHVGQISKD